MTIRNNKVLRSPARRAAFFPALPAALALALALCLLAGCGAGQSAASAAAGFSTDSAGSTGGPEGNDPEQQSAAVPAGPAGELKLLMDPSAAGEAAFGRDGMYHIKYGSPALIYYQDYAAGEDRLFCTDPGCGHSGPDCASWAAADIATDGSRLIYLHWDDANCPAISVAALDGGRRFQVCSFGENEEIGSLLAGDGRSLYYLLGSSPGPQQPLRLTLERFDLPSRTRTELYVLSEGSAAETTWGLDAACGDSLILESFDREGNLALSRYNLADGSMTVLMEGSNDDCLLRACEDWLFRFTVGEDGESVRLEAENWRDGRSFEMPGCFISATGAAGFYPVGFYHNTLFVTAVAGHDQDGELIVRQYAVDCETQSLRDATHLDPVTRRPQVIVGGYTLPDGTRMLMIEVHEYSGSNMESYTGTHYEPVRLEEYLS